MGVDVLLSGSRPRRSLTVGTFAALLLQLLPASGAGAQSSPLLETVYPAGGRAGTTVTVALAGARLGAVRSIRSDIPGARAVAAEGGAFRIEIPAATTPGAYDLWAVTDGGIAGPRAFRVGVRPESAELEPVAEMPAKAKSAPVDLSETVQTVPLGATVNGRIAAAGDRDFYRFRARRGQRVLIECWAERIDSRLRPVLDLSDATGRPVAAARLGVGTDPILDFRVPADGEYQVRVDDLVSAGGADYVYRLDLDSGPRVAFATPSVIRRGHRTRVRLYGWNLNPPATASTASPVEGLDVREVEIPAGRARPEWPLPLRLGSHQFEFSGASVYLPGSSAAVGVGVTDLPVLDCLEPATTAAAARPLPIPSEASSTFAPGTAAAWFSIEAHRGEVLYLEAIAHRVQSPADAQISVWDAAGRRELVQFGDELSNPGGRAFPVNHLDPSGRWVAPAEGRFLIAVRNLVGGPRRDPRAVFRLAVRREEPEFRVVALPPSEDGAALNVARGGSAALEVLAFRRRGMTESIRVWAEGLPAGLHCPEIWLGPGSNRGALSIRADDGAAVAGGEIRFMAATGDSSTGVPVRIGTVVRPGSPNGWSRLTSGLQVGVAGTSALRLSAHPIRLLQHQLYGALPVVHSPGGSADVEFEVARPDSAPRGTVRLTGVGLPEGVAPIQMPLAQGETRGGLALFLPTGLPVGRYTFLIRADLVAADGKLSGSPVYSEPILLDVRTPGFRVISEAAAPLRVKRGEIFQIPYSAQRTNGFIGKIHTELASPGIVTNVVGLRGRGETFVGGTDRGSIQVEVNRDAPLGSRPFLRLFSVGVVEDEPVYQSSCLLPLEIVE